MSTLDLDIRPVAGRIGAEVAGVTLSADLPDATVAAIDEALHRYKVLFFRDQGHLDDASLEAFAARLVQIGLNTLSNKQVAYLRSLKTDLGRAPTDKRFLEARSRALDFFKNDTRNAGLKEGTEDAIDWRERAIDAINSKLTNSRLASAASEDFHADGDIEGLRDTLYKITGDEQYITSTVPSEQGATGGPDDEIKEYGTLREDPSRTVGTKNSAIERRASRPEWAASLISAKPAGASPAVSSQADQFGREKNGSSG